jgi:hypothetical protein
VSGALNYKPAPFGADASAKLVWFGSLCAKNGVRYFPASPTAVAAFVLAMLELREPGARIAEVLDVIAQAHDAAMLPNPVATGIVRAALSRISAEEANEGPRRWSQREKAEYWTLPPSVREVITRRDRERERTIAIALQEAAELKRQLAAAKVREDPLSDNERQAAAPMKAGRRARARTVSRTPRSGTSSTRRGTPRSLLF